MADAKNQEKGNIFLRTGKRISKWFREMRSEQIARKYCALHRE